MDELISVIIPVYNGEEYLEKCLDSICRQTYRNLEIIIVDDGSIDNSLLICNQYASRDERIRIFPIANHGVSYARNFAIKKAQGKYITFVDCDDYVNEDMIHKMYHFSDGADIVLAEFLGVDLHSGKPEKKHINREVLRPINSAKDLGGQNFDSLYKRGLFNAPFSKLFKRTAIQYFFNENLRVGEDFDFNIEFLRSAQSVRYLPEFLYYYRINNSRSATKQHFDSVFEELYSSHVKSISIFDEIFQKNYNRQLVDKRIVDFLVWKLVNMYRSGGNSLQQNIKVFKNVYNKYKLYESKYYFSKEHDTKKYNIRVFLLRSILFKILFKN